jgi:lysyl-tRNA synthetase class 2
MTTPPTAGRPPEAESPAGSPAHEALSSETDAARREDAAHHEIVRAELEVRRGKRDRFRALGVDPYPPRFAREDPAAGIRARFEEAERMAASGAAAGESAAPAPLRVRTAGRIRAMRDHGKTTFLTIQDESGSIQLYFKKNLIPETYDRLTLLDLGDFVGVAGEVFRTRSGEVTVQVAEWEVLAKALEPLPSKWHGLSDVEIRYRRRYLDLVANSDVAAVFRRRASIVRTIRSFLAERGFMEVETPMMQAMAGGAAARPFVTHHNALGVDLFMRIAPELYLKRLVVGGFERVFELNRNFRNEGMDRNHNPEFTMLELYQAYADYNDMMAITESLVHAAAMEANGSPEVRLGVEHGRVVSLAPPWERVTYFDAIHQNGGPRLDPGDEAAAVAAVKAAGLEPETYAYGDLLDALFGRYAETHLVGPVFVTDYPTAGSPLAKRMPGAPHLVERFEAYIGGMEVANAFSELNDPDDQESRFREQSDRIDDDYVSALRIGMPPTGGLGIGIDRLTMILTGSRTIRDVILFPAMKPE